MTNELSKAIMNKSKLKDRYTKWLSHETFLAFKKQKNICKNLNKDTALHIHDKTITNCNSN